MSFDPITYAMCKGGGVEVFKLQDYGIDFYEIYMGGQEITHVDSGTFVADVYNAFKAGKVPYIFLHDIAPTYSPVALDGYTVDFSAMVTIGGFTRFDVMINDSSVRMVGTKLGA